ncbi:MAG: hypothetical protein RQ966_00205 [Acetobacteraceae bacterium]|nr:hypothetical protein [Acetobacteraceae bacterium]
MIKAHEFLDEAERLAGTAPPPSEAARRRAVSTAYYGLFHTLTEAGAALLTCGPDAQRAQISRSFNHALLRTVSERVWRERFDPPWDRLFPAKPSDEIRLVASTVIELQAARIASDYDLSETISLEFMSGRVLSARRAALAFAAIAGTDEARAFLLAALLSDRWGRRG